MSISLQALNLAHDTPLANTEQIRICLRAINELFAGYFDKNWFLLLLEDLPIRSSTLSEIRELLVCESIKSFDAKKVQEGIPVLEGFANDLRHYLLPSLREKLGISGLLPEMKITDKAQLLLRKFIAYAFPSNLNTLTLLIEQLKAHFEATIG